MPAARVALASALGVAATAGRPFAWTALALFALVGGAMAFGSRGDRVRAAPVVAALAIVAGVALIAEIAQ